MTRATIDFFDTAGEAAESAAALHRVGLSAGDVGALWVTTAAPLDAASGEPAHRLVETAELGPVAASGWLGHTSRPADGEPVSDLSLATVLAPAEPSPEILARVAETLRSGGGIVVVRATEEPVGA